LNDAKFEGIATSSIESTLDGEIPDIKLDDICHSQDFHGVRGITTESSLVKISQQI
jgi:hypothetical protein